MMPFLFPLGVFLALFLIWFFFRKRLQAPPARRSARTRLEFYWRALPRPAIRRDGGSLVLSEDRRARLCAGAGGLRSRRRAQSEDKVEAVLALLDRRMKRGGAQAPALNFASKTRVRRAWPCASSATPSRPSRRSPRASWPRSRPRGRRGWPSRSRRSRSPNSRQPSRTRGRGAPKRTSRRRRKGRCRRHRRSRLPLCTVHPDCCCRLGRRKGSRRHLSRPRHGRSRRHHRHRRRRHRRRQIH